MVQFVNVENLVKLIKSTGVAPFIEGMLEYIESDFQNWEKFEKLSRLASHSKEGVIELMPASCDQTYSFKYVNGHPKNTLTDQQTVTAFGMLAHVSTGYPYFLSEMTVLTALRTAATSVLAAKYLAKKDAATMAMIGLGAQSEFQAIAFNSILGIKKLHIFDVDNAAVTKFLSNIEDIDVEVRIDKSAADTVLGADIITTSTADKLQATILSDNMVGAGVHINAIGGDCPGKTELQKDILSRADVFVEFPEQTRVEGEIQQMEPDFPVTELWRVITGEVTGRSNADQITVFDSVGFAIEDYSAMRFLYDSVQGTDYVDEIGLLAEPQDPRNLYGLINND